MMSRILKSLLGTVVALAILLGGLVVFVDSESGRAWLGGLLSRYSGQTITLEGEISMGMAPPALRVSDVAVADGASAPWLRAEEVLVSLARTDWPPSADNPLSVSISDVSLNPERFAKPPADDRRDGAFLLPAAPFPVAARIERLRVERSTDDGPESYLTAAELHAEPSGSVRAGVDATIAGRPFSASLRIDPGIETESKGALVDAAIDYTGFTLLARGNVADYRELRGIDLVLAAGTESAKPVPAASPFIRRYVEGRLTGDLGNLRFDLERLEAVTAHGAFDAVARIRQEDQALVVEDAVISARSDDLKSFLGDFGVATALSMPVTVDTHVHGDRQRIEIERLNVDLGSGEALLKASGSIARGGEGEPRYSTREVVVELTVREIARLIEGFGVDSIVNGSLVGTARLSGSRGALSVDSLDVDLGGGALVARGSGSATLDGEEYALSLPFEAAADDISAVVPRVPMADWFGRSGKATGTLDYTNGRFGLLHLDATFQSETGGARLTGDIEDIETLVAPNIEIALRAAQGGAEPSSERGIRSLDLTLALPQGIDGRARANAVGDLKLGDFTFDGVIESPRQRGGVSGSFTFEPKFALEDGGARPLLASSLIEGEISIGSLESRRFNFFATLPGSAGSIVYEGEYAEDSSGSGTLKVNGVDPNVIAAIGGAKTRIPYVVHLQAALNYDSRGFILSDAVMFTGASEMSGRVEVAYPVSAAGSPRLEVNARSTQLYLADFGMESRSDDEPGYFSRAPLNLGVFDDVELDARLYVDWLHSTILDYRDVDLVGRSAGGLLDLRSSQKLLGGGSSRMEFAADVRDALPKVRLDLELEGVDPGELRAVKEGGERYSGDIDVEIEIEGRGDSVQQILSGADGYFLMRINDAVIPNQKLNLLSADFLFETLRVVNPFVRQSNEMELECGLIAFAISSGKARADNTVLIKGRRLLIVGEGEIDLGTEKVAMVIRPKAQEGIGFNTSGLVKFIGIGGTLSNPEFRTDPKGLAITGATIGAAIASGGMSLFLQNMFDRLTTGRKECERAEAVFRDLLEGGSAASAPVRSPFQESGAR